MRGTLASDEKGRALTSCASSIPASKPLFASPEKKWEYIERTDEYQELLIEIRFSQSMFQQTVRNPNFYTDKEKDYWERHLSDLYARRDTLDQEFELDPP